MPSLSETLDLAKKHYQAGQFRQAEQLYGQVLDADGHDPEIWYLLAETCI